MPRSITILAGRFLLCQYDVSRVSQDQKEVRALYRGGITSHELRVTLARIACRDIDPAIVADDWMNRELFDDCNQMKVMAALAHISNTQNPEAARVGQWLMLEEPVRAQQ